MKKKDALNISLKFFVWYLSVWFFKNDPCIFELRFSLKITWLRFEIRTELQQCLKWPSQFSTAVYYALTQGSILNTVNYTLWMPINSQKLSLEMHYSILRRELSTTDFSEYVCGVCIYINRGLAFYMSTLDLNSGPHVCILGALPTESPSWPQDLFLS